MAKFLVTGGAGFIGSHLVDQLLSLGHTVRVLDNFLTGTVENLSGGCDVLEGDIRDEEALDAAFENVEGCFHLAAIASVQRSVDHPRATSDINGNGTIAVFEAAIGRGGIPVVYASSAAIYGSNDDLPLREQAEPRPLSPYAADKYGNELQARALGVSRGLRSMGLRFFNVYGPRQDPLSPYSGVISIFGQKAKQGEELIIHGDGTQRRDFIHVSDVTRFLVAAMTRTESTGPVVNVCTGQATSIEELAQTLVNLHGGRIRKGPSRPGDIKRSVGSPELARQVLGVSAEVTLQAGLATL